MYKYRYQNIQLIIYYIMGKFCKFFHVVLVMSMFNLILLIFMMLCCWDKPFISHFYWFTVIVISSLSSLLIGLQDFNKMGHQAGTIIFSCVHWQTNAPLFIIWNCVYEHIHITNALLLLRLIFSIHLWSIQTLLSWLFKWNEQILLGLLNLKTQA